MCTVTFCENVPPFGEIKGFATAEAGVGVDVGVAVGVGLGVDVGKKISRSQTLRE